MGACPGADHLDRVRSYIEENPVRASAWREAAGQGPQSITHNPGRHPDRQECLCYRYQSTTAPSSGW